MDAIGDVSKKEAEHLQSIQQYYIEQKNLVQNDYDSFLDQIEVEKNALTKIIEKERKTYEEIIEQFKRSEEAKTKQDFYRIVLSHDEISDVKKLKQIAEELHDPSVLYKLIYKTYYERPFNELMGRLGGGKTGIYKITNIENGKVYIGQTKQEFSTRLRTHVKRGLRAEPTTKNKLYNAMWEDGVENFTFEILSECNADELNEKEKEFIAFFKSTEWGYNSN